MDHPQLSFLPPTFASSSYSCPPSCASESRLIAEERAEEILLSIQATALSEEQRKEAIDCVQNVLRGHYGVEVIPFGSVPLGTYLPDGDIDLTVICRPNEEEECAKGIANFLQVRQKEEDLQIRDVVYICAQVKIVKFSWKNIPVDMSFNQIAGLSSLCFLEKIDQAIGKNHLFKRSIILIKAWCFYESRILGAHHGLLSAFGLETLVLYTINRFYGSLDGPLMVLYSFLDFYSTFDWESYCMSVYGPITISSLQNASDMKGNEDANLFLSKEFLDSCKLPCSGSSTSSEPSSKVFPVKYLNIMDPFKDDNNLGRSVNKANFHRMKCALAYAAEKLREILTMPVGRVGEEIEKFFKYTIDRNGRGHRPDVQVPIPAFGTGKYKVESLLKDYNTFYNNFMYSQWCRDCPLPQEDRPPLCTHSSNRHQLGVFNQSASPRKGTEVFLPEPRYCYENPLEPFRRARGSSSRNHSMNCIQRRALGGVWSRQQESSSPFSFEQGDEANYRNEEAETFEGERIKHLDISAVDLTFLEPTANVDSEMSNRVNDPQEEFPLLSSSIRYTDSKLQSDPARGESQQLSTTILFGSFRVSDLIGEPTPATRQRKEPDPGNTESLNQVESLECSSVDQGYELKNMEEFPPLC